MTVAALMEMLKDAKPDAIVKIDSNEYGIQDVDGAHSTIVVVGMRRRTSGHIVEVEQSKLDDPELLFIVMREYDCFLLEEG